VLSTASLFAGPLLGQGAGKARSGPPGGGDVPPPTAFASMPATDTDGPAATGQRPSGTLVFLTRGNRLTSIDVQTGRRTVRRVAVASCGPELYVTGGHVVFAVVRKRQTVVFSVPITLDQPPRRLGSAHAFVPSATDGRVWLAGVDCNKREMVGAREVTIEGQVTFRSHHRVPGSWLAGAVEGGLVVQRARSLSVWDPSTGRTRRQLSLEAVTALRGNRIVGCAERSGCRSLVIVDAETANRVVASPSNPYRLDLGGEFSPDGSLLATPAVADRRWSVALVNTRDGTTVIVPGSRTGAVYPELSWAPSSGWLYFRTAGRHIMAYRPGQKRAVTLPFQLPRQARAFMAG
jgi:hypothetical protein